RSVHLAQGYAGTVTMSAPHLFETLEMTSPGAAVAQPWGPDGMGITVTGSFVWTGGALNSDTNPSTLRVAGGSAVVTPGGDVLGTNDTIRFDKSLDGLTASAGVFSAGTVEFGSGTGVVVSDGCAVTVDTDGGGVTLLGVEEALNAVTVEAGGGLTA